jgi:hypothetical protein
VSDLLTLIKKRNWDHVELPWLPAGEIQADPIGDLRTKGNRLSVWHIEEDESNLSTVLVGLVANRAKIDKLEYGLFSEDLVAQVGLKMEETPGELQMQEANPWHRDLVELSGSSLVRLATALFPSLRRKLLLEDEAKDLLASHET